MPYDIVGDVHGHDDALIRLLGLLGYEQRGGAWQHPERHMVFVGDLVDRGPGQLAVIDIARRMQDAGRASICMGNHEFNAIGWATAHRTRSGATLRERNHKNTDQHRAFLDAVGADSALHRELVAWMRTLPLWLEFPGFGVVHACWHEAAMQALGPYLTADHRLTEDGLHAVFERGTAAYVAAETVLKGLEVELPAGVSFHDKDGHVRHNTRVRWWDESATTYRAAALVDRETAQHLPDTPLPPEAIVVSGLRKPVFFGHYWLTGTPTLTAPTRACLDFSVAREGYLCAYRWDGEAVLRSDHLVQVAAHT